MNEHKVLKNIKNKVCLVTGGTGSIGSEIVKQLIRYKPKQIRIYSRDESKQFNLQHELGRNRRDVNIRYLIGDIRDKDRLDKAFWDVDLVFHAAALKHVSFCEYNPFETIKTNVHGTQNVIDLAIKHNVEKMIAISTDKAVYPNTMLGMTKLLMERMVISAINYVESAKTKFSVVRFGNVINSRGSVIPLWINQIKKGGPVTVTDKKMRRFFLTVEDAVKLIFIGLTMMKGEEIFVLKMKEENIGELAQKTIAKYSGGKKIPIKIIGPGLREKTQEFLFTDEEKKCMLERELFYVILPDEALYRRRKSNYRL